MSQPPLIPFTQWALIEGLLPLNARDRQLISAIAFRQSTAVSLRDISEVYGLSRARINEWETKLQRDGSLARVLRALGLEPAGQLSWRRGGQSWSRRYGNADGVLDYQLSRFAQQLGRKAPSNRRKAGSGAVSPAK
jgi:hypothetical protein